MRSMGWIAYRWQRELAFIPQAKNVMDTGEGTIWSPLERVDLPWDARLGMISTWL